MILCISDLHGFDIIEGLDKLDMTGYDAVFCCGDFEYFETAQTFLEFIKKHDLPFYYVPGNFDNDDIQSLLNEYDVNKKPRKFKHWNIVGLSGAIAVGPNGKTEEQLMEQLTEMQIDDNTIILSHTPPKGALDDPMPNKNIGSQSLTDIIIRKIPYAVICGHVHETEGYELFYNTHIFKVPPAINGSIMSVTLEPLDFVMIDL